MNYCVECGTRLELRPCPGEGMVPYCPSCKTFRFPIFNTAVSMEVMDPSRSRVLLIRQYGKKRNILVAGYVNRGECAEHTVAREVMEEIGLHVSDIRFQKSKFFEPSNTLMLNFSCVADSDDLSGMTAEVDSAAWFSFDEAVQEIAQDSLAQEFLIHFLNGIQPVSANSSR
ncbi:MAG: NAD(+) diphosphatase [Butyricicoccaceae bacterium]